MGAGVSLGAVSLTERVLRVLNKHDPEELLAVFGAVAEKDEYMPEAVAFAARLRRGEAVTPEVVTEVWEHFFGPSSGLSAHADSEAVATLAADLTSLRTPER